MSKENNATNYTFEENTLKKVLHCKLNKRVQSVKYEEKQLQGGTVADVRLITGTATAGTETIPFDVVLKVQDKWERFADEHSWRREYDLYLSKLCGLFNEDFSWPRYYLMEKEEDQIRIWMEYADGVKGNDFTVEMYAKAAEALGRFQGKLYKEQPCCLDNITNLSNQSFIKDTFYRYSTWPEANDFLRGDDCTLPKHLQSMLIELIDNGDKYWELIEKLPIVFSQRDYWFTNIFLKDDKITCIDWDTTGWGHLGEDIASLISDEIMPDMVPKLYEACVPAYYKGFKEFVPEFDTDSDLIYELILVSFGLRIMADHMYSKTDEDKKLNADILDSIYNLKQKENAM